MLHEIADRIDDVLGFAEPHRARFRDAEARRAPRRHRHPAATPAACRRRARELPSMPSTADATTASGAEALAISARTSSRRCASTHVPPISASAAVKRARRSPSGTLNSGTSGRGRGAGCAARIFARKASRVVISVASGFSDTTRGRFRRARPAGRADGPRYSAGCTARSSADACSAPPSEATVARYSVGLASSRPAIFSTSCFTNGTSWRSAITSRHL